MKKYLVLITIVFLMISCVSTKSTLKNLDDTTPIPGLTSHNTFVITEYSKDKQYGYQQDYPINVFYKNTKDETLNQKRFLDALVGPKGEKINYKKLESCCPFPTKRNEIGAGFLDVYELSWEGLKTPIKLYLNSYEKGALLIAVGLNLKKY